MINKIIKGDCLVVMKKIPDKKIDMILTDLPYGKTARNEWDIIIPLDKLWEEYKRIIKDNGVIALTSVEPFTSMLVMSNIKMFRYDLVWEKVTPTGHYNAKKMPLRNHESILIFYKKVPMYNPQKIEGGLFHKNKIIHNTKSKNYQNPKLTYISNLDGKYYPRSIIGSFAPNKKKLHPTQKPLKLFEYLIETYTKKNDIVLDSCIGSGTTAIACISLDRRYVGIEKVEEFVKMANLRIVYELTKGKEK